MPAFGGKPKNSSTVSAAIITFVIMVSASTYRAAEKRQWSGYPSASISMRITQSTSPLALAAGPIPARIGSVGYGRNRSPYDCGTAETGHLSQLQTPFTLFDMAALHHARLHAKGVPKSTDEITRDTTSLIVVLNGAYGFSADYCLLPLLLQAKNWPRT